MKCPICSTVVKANGTVCPCCGFNDIRYEFINDEELKMWQTYVVNPCKFAYRLNDSLKKEVEALRGELKSACFRGEARDLGSAPPENPKTVVRSGWNYDAPIAHPNNARCEHTIYHNNVELTDIHTQVDASRNGTITFVAQRVEDSPEKKKYSIKEKTVGFCWRIKDPKGVIKLTGRWDNNNLLIGDAIAGKVELKNVPNGYSIDFVDYAL